MVRIDTEVGEWQLLAAGMIASPVWLDRHEYRIDRCEGFGIIKLEDPHFLVRIVLVEDSKAERLLLIHAAWPPRLERAGVFQACFLAEVIRVENKRFSLRVETPVTSGSQGRHAVTAKTVA